jgi:hypothetical protein
MLPSSSLVDSSLLLDFPSFSSPATLFTRAFSISPLFPSPFPCSFSSFDFVSPPLHFVPSPPLTLVNSPASSPASPMISSPSSTCSSASVLLHILDDCLDLSLARSVLKILNLPPSDRPPSFVVSIADENSIQPLYQLARSLVLPADEIQPNGENQL